MVSSPEAPAHSGEQRLLKLLFNVTREPGGSPPRSVGVFWSIAEDDARLSRVVS